MLKHIQQHPKGDLYIFIFFTFLAFWMHHLSNSAVLSYSLKPVEVFLHEASHGLAVLLTGNFFESLHLEWRQGHVMSRVYLDNDVRMERIIISFSGYTGASLWGLLIYATSIYASKVMKVVLIVFSAFFFLYIDGFTTGLILSFVIAVFVAGWYLGVAGCYFLRFLGIFVMLNSIYSPTYLWSYDQIGDHISLSKLTFLPSFVFILIWVAIGLYCLRLAYKITLTKTRSMNTQSPNVSQTPLGS